MKISNIVIVGGGTAAWATAHQFINKTNHSVKITVVNTPEIPTIGVGESTTGRFYDLINLKNNITGLNEEDFLKETESTYKLGIKHSDWKEIGQHFYSPIGDNYENETKYPHKDYDYMRIYHVAKKKSYTKTFQSALMNENKLHIVDGVDVFKDKESAPIAYHLDTFKVGQYLKKKAINCIDRCKYVEGKVTNFTINKDGFIESVITDNNQEIKGDLFIDCTGFARSLIGKVYTNKFISYENELLVNRALNFNIKYDSDTVITNYTHAWAQKNGGMWQIPTQKRLGCGYVFSDNHITPEKAKEEIENVLGKKIDIQRDISFKSGRLDKLWIKNVLSTGLSSGFVEPLEATSIHATTLQITHFIENYYKEDMPIECDILHKKYNQEMTQMWDHIKDFIVFHYITPRKDTNFWIESSKKDRRSDRINEMIELWKHRMPRVIDYTSDEYSNFYHIGNVLWYQIAIGMSMLNPTLAKKELIDYNLWDYSENKFNEVNNFVKDKINKSITTNEYYNKL